MVLEARSDHEMDRQNSLRWVAYHTAAWQRVKKFPSWNRVLLKRRKAQSMQQMRSAAIAWTMLMGGTVRKSDHGR